MSNMHTLSSELLESNAAYKLLNEQELIENFCLKTDKIQASYELLDEHLEAKHIELDDVLDLPFVEVDGFYDFLSNKRNIPLVNLGKMSLHLDIDAKLDTDFLKEKLIFPIKNDSLSMQLATYNPYDKSIVYETMKRVGKNISLVLVRKEPLKRYIFETIINRELGEIISNIKIDLKDINKKNLQEESNTVKMLELIISKGIQNRASDIHLEFEQTSKKAHVRFRIDGLLYERFEFEETVYLALSSTLKLFSNIDFVNTTKAQDGRFSYEIDGSKFDFRVSVIPLFNGESVSVRILQKKNFLVDVRDLGLSKQSHDVLTKVSNYPNGLILVTGPTGSGKTTTLYSILNSINNSYKKIITVEDPVEYELARIQQIQVKIRSDLNFSNILKSILRHDPDVIMIGEVRDSDSLKIAVESALTGHLVFTTLHTNDSISSIIRLKEMGVEEYLIANSLLAVHAQRLVRKLCKNCTKEYEPSELALEDIQHLLPEKYTFYYGEGCNECAMTGFSGREIISETIFVDQELSSALNHSLDYATLTEIAKKNGFVSMLENGIQKALEGKSSIHEILKSVYV